MKEWPKDNETVSAAEVLEATAKAIRFAYSMKRKNKDKSIPWPSYNIGKSELAGCFPADENLSAEYLESSLRDQGRDALDEILGVLFRIGIEQGRRIFQESPVFKLQMMRLRLIESQLTETERTEP